MPFIDSDGVRLYAEQTGSGTPVVWVHEFAADYRTWEGQVRRFSRDYRCVTYNARGYPPSDVPGSGEAYTYEHHREDLRAVLDGFGIGAAHVVGLSMGAYAGLQFALRYPGRVLSLLFASGGSGSVPAGQRSEGQRDEGQRGEGQRGEGQRGEGLQDDRQQEDRLKDDRQRDDYARDTLAGAERMLRDGMESGADGLALGAARVQLLGKDPRGWAEFKGYLAEHSALGSSLTLRNYQARRPSLYDFEAELRRLDVPVLLAVGDEDDAVIEVNIFLKRTLPRAGLWISPKTGHGINLEEPGAFNEMTARFLAAAERGGWGRRDPRASPGQSHYLGDQARP